MNKRMIFYPLLLLCFLTILSACTTVYSLRLPAGQASGGPGGQGIGQGGGPGGQGTSREEQGGSGETSREEQGGSGEVSLPTKVDHLFFEPRCTLPIADFSTDKSYFVADFDANLSIYSGRGRYLFALYPDLTPQEQTALLEDCAEQDSVLVKISRDQNGQSRTEYTVYTINSHPNMKRLMVVTEGADGADGEKQLSLYDYVEQAPQGIESLFTFIEPEPKKRYSDEWVKWLISGKQEEYPECTELFLEKTLFKGEENAFCSFAEDVSAPKSADYSLQVALPRRYEFYSRPTSYRWLVFYRERDLSSSANTSAFEMLEVKPWQARVRRDKEGNIFRYHYLDLFSAGMAPTLFDGEMGSYEMVFVICYIHDEQQLCWGRDVAQWTRAVAEIEPDARDPFFATWISYAGYCPQYTEGFPTKDRFFYGQYNSDTQSSAWIAEGQSKNGEQVWSLAFRYDTRLMGKIDRIYVKEVGKTGPYRRFGGNCTAEEGLQWATFLLYSDADLSFFDLREDGSFNLYELVIVSDNNRFFVTRLEWNDSAQLYKEKVEENNKKTAAS